MATASKPITALTVTQKYTQVHALLTSPSVVKEMTAAVPRFLNPETLIRVACTAVQRTPKLLECDVRSLIGAVIQSGQLGLVPDGFLGQAYLVPFNNRKTGRLEAQLQIGYRGLIQLGHRSERISSIQSDVVRAGDMFDYEYGSHKHLKHKPDLMKSLKDRGEIIGAYAHVRFRDGSDDFEVMSREQIEEIRASSKASDDGPWVSHWEEMAKKTTIRRLYKRMPVSTEDQGLVKAAVLDEYADAGVAQDLGAIVESNEVVRTATVERTEELARKYGPAETLAADPPANQPAPAATEPQGVTGVFPEKRPASRYE